ncbi:MAG: DUF2207 domain-containing protein [Bacilli bacterium]|nr:DUF2207 domain-containing protein [Bacilli bacterium]
MKQYIQDKIYRIDIKKLLLVFVILLIITTFITTFMKIEKEIYSELTKDELVSDTAEYLKENKAELVEKYNTTDEAIIMEKLANEAKLKIVMVTAIFSTIVAFVKTIIDYFMVIVLFVVFYLWHQKYDQYRLTESSFTATKNRYYRDILKNYSVDVLSYVENLKLEYPSILIAMLLQLEHKKIVTLTAEAIIVHENIDQTQLLDTEQYLLKNIKDGTLSLSHYEQYEKIVEKEAIKEQLLTPKKYPKKRLRKDILFSLIGFMMVVVLYIVTYMKITTINFENHPYVALFIMMGLVLTPIILLLYLVARIISYSVLTLQLKTDFSYVNLKGKNIKQKLDGLKNFLQDFSLLSERGKEELGLWEEYLIYSVLFNQNSSIIKQYKALIRR